MASAKDIPAEPQWLTPAERKAWMALVGLAVRLPPALDSQLQADDGLSFFEYMVLAVLSEQDDWTMQMSDIAAASSSSLSRLSHTAKRLEQEGYLRRERVPGAGRRTNAILTEAGHDKVVVAAPGHVARVRELLIDAISDRDLAVLRRVVEKVLLRIDPEDGCAGLDVT